MQSSSTSCRPGQPSAGNPRRYLKNLGYPIFKTILHQYVAYREAIAAGLSVIEYDKTSKAAQELTSFFREIIGVVT